MSSHLIDFSRLGTCWRSRKGCGSWMTLRLVQEPKHNAAQIIAPREAAPNIARPQKQHWYEVEICNSCYCSHLEMRRRKCQSQLGDEQCESIAVCCNEPPWLISYSKIRLEFSDKVEIAKAYCPGPSARDWAIVKCLNLTGLRRTRLSDASRLDRRSSG